MGSPARGWPQRQADAEPAPAGGQAYAKVLIQQGDRQCLANQALHGQAQNIQTLLSQASHYVPSLYQQRAPATWAKQVDVPVFVSGAFQDEQTGGQWPAIIQNLAHDPEVWATITNGTHIDSLGPGAITRWLEFLDLYVADQVPTPSPTLATLAPAHLPAGVAGAPSGPVAPVGYTDEPTLAAARAAFEQQPRVRVLFDNGGGSAGARGHAAGLEPGLHRVAPTRRPGPPPPPRRRWLAHRPHRGRAVGHGRPSSRTRRPGRPTTSPPATPGPPSRPTSGSRPAAPTGWGSSPPR